MKSNNSFYVKLDFMDIIAFLNANLMYAYSNNNQFTNYKI